MSDFDGGAGGSSGGDHDGFGHGFHGGAFAGSGGCGNDSGFAYGFLGHALAFMGVTEGSEEGGRIRGMRRVRLPGLANASRSTQVLVWPHGACDPEAIAKQVMRKHGFRDIAHKKRDTAPYVKTENELRDTTPFDGHMFNSPMPNGWYPQATGFTRSFKNYWQIPRRKYWYSSLEVDVQEPVHLVLSGATWFFNEMGDYETRISMTIASRPLLKHGEWRHREDLISKHMAAARGAASALFEAIRAIEPSKSALTQRQVQAEAEALAAKLKESLELPRPVRSDNPSEKQLPVKWPRTNVVKPLDTASPDPLQFDEGNNGSSK